MTVEDESLIALDSQVALKYIDCDMPFRRMTIQDRKKTKASFIENFARLCDRLATQTDENAADAAGAGNAPSATHCKSQSGLSTPSA